MPFLQDLRYGLRTLSRTPGFTAIAVAVLALGIGANATVFSLANAVFLRPLPVADADAVVRVYDPLTFGAVTLLLALVACVAALAPALRAARLDPLVALRTL
jgi:ABC-type antimicrobial peptide transport system permease subunit